MSNSKILPRQLSAEGCRIVGAELKASLARLSEQGNVLDSKVLASAAVIEERTARFSSLEEPREPMRDVDHGTDSTVASLHAMISAGETLYTHSHTELLPLSAEEEARRDAFVTLREALFPEGTGYLNFAHREQWAKLDELRAAIEKNQPLLSSVGLKLEAERALQWIDRYGVRLGITRVITGVTDPSSRAIIEWHEAWSDFTADVRSAYKDRSDITQIQLRSALLGGYDRRAEEERDKARRPRKKS